MSVTPITPAMSTSPDTGTTRIRNPQHLLIIRLVWVVLALLAVGIFAISVPVEIETLRDSEYWAVGYQPVLTQIGMSREFFAIFLTLFEVVPISVASILALVIFRRRSDDWMALFVALTLIFLAVAGPLTIFQLDPNLGAMFTSAGIVSFLTILYLFPNGYFVPRWSGWFIIPSLLFGIAFFPIRVALHVGGAVPPSFPFVFIGIIALVWIAFAAQVYRYRRISTPSQRQQSKWVLLGILVNILIFNIYFIVPTIFPSAAHPGPLPQPPVYTLESLTWMFVSVPVILFSNMCIPLAIGLSMLRYRLWDVDLAINRSLVYGAVTILLALIFGGIVALVSAVTQGQGSVLGAVGAAVVATALFNPARKAAQRFVDRRIYRLNFDLNQLADAQKLPEIKNPGALSGRKLDAYDVLDVIGKGGMGEVYKGQSGGQTVALKILPDDLAQQTEFRQRFDREAQTLTALNHPNIVHMVSSGTFDGVLYLAMEYINGTELGDKLKYGALQLDEVRDIVKGLASALDYAHEQGFVHRDIKPSNVMLRRSQDGETTDAVLMDFGIAKIKDARTRFTNSGAIGTIDYMAPEQIMAAKEVDRRADVYALGVMIYEMLTGERPFKGGAAQVMFAHLQQPAPDPRDVKDSIPREVAKAIQKALAKKPDERFATAGELAQAL